MIKLKSLLLESEDATSNGIDINYIEHRLTKLISSSEKIHLNILIDWYYSDDKQKRDDIIDYFKTMNEVYNRALDIVNKLKIPNVDIRFLKSYITSQEEFSYDINTFFPLPLYVSSNKDDEMTVGIMVDINGKVLEIHEGNDEATPETISMVNRLVNPVGKMVRIYATHDTKLVYKIDETGYLPPGLYVSPSKNYAEGYMDLEGKRSMFTGLIDINSINQESDMDWKTISNTKIERFKWL